MFKLLCVFAVYFAVICAEEKKAEITWGRIIKGKDYPGVTITSSKEKTDITWNEPVNAQINPLKLTYNIGFTKKKTTEYVKLENLCGDVKKGTSEERVKKFILKTLTSSDDCPIKKGAKATFKVPSISTFKSDKNQCGPYRSEFNIFRARDQGNALPIITGIFRGNITGCK
ncbi:uncharacterized protein LOC122501889 [Leptopilina heterotoma]|uniref:uncharacterized protein LOC122501889 n=1 Tax=Leptopilina heterotoma TaxID=63436 RepID=UPI001CA89C82|nr:uncharacterized protein LOC122501889 [Leptopilina heterotoma]